MSRSYLLASRSVGGYLSVIFAFVAPTSVWASGVKRPVVLSQVLGSESEQSCLLETYYPDEETGKIMGRRLGLYSKPCAEVTATDFPSHAFNIYGLNEDDPQARYDQGEVGVFDERTNRTVAILRWQGGHFALERGLFQVDSASGNVILSYNGVDQELPEPRALCRLQYPEGFFGPDNAASTSEASYGYTYEDCQRMMDDVRLWVDSDFDRFFVYLPEEFLF